MATRLNERWQMAGICIGLAGITFAVFGQTLTHEFIAFDDSEYVYGNPVVSQGLTFKGVLWAFTQTHAANWHPLTWLSHMLDCQLYGLHPAGHHLTNVLLHTATVILLFLVLCQMTAALWRSAFVAAVFAIHPLRVESVAWVAERKDVLSGVFFMLTIGAYVRYARRSRSPVRYGLVMLLFGLGLMSKPMLVTLPLVLLLLDYWPLERNVECKMQNAKWRGLVLEKLPLLALSAVSCAATLFAQRQAIESALSFSLPLRLANAPISCLIYLGQMVWPTGLALLYPYPHNGFPPSEVALAVVFLTGISAFAWCWRREHPWILMGWLWYLVMLLPVLGIIKVGEQSHADRFTYLPQIGIVIAATWLVAEWCVKHSAGRIVSGSFMTIVIAVLMLCAWKQTAYWKDDETLWSRSVACTTDNETAQYNLGNALLKEGKSDDAIVHYEAALEIKPAHEESQVNLGNALLQEGKPDDAIVHYQAALEMKPGDEEAHINFGNALLQKGNAESAIVHFQKALEIGPDYAEAHFGLGNAFLRKGSADEAIFHYQKTLEINPANADAQFDLGSAFLQKGRLNEAAGQFEKALQIEPDNPQTLNALALLLATGPGAALRNGEKAVNLAQRASVLTGGENPVILHTLAAAFAETGHFSDAIRTAQKAAQLARSAGLLQLVAQLNTELKRYQAGLPSHQ